MKYFTYLRNTFFLYVTSGIVFGVAIFSLIIIHKYNSHLTNTLRVAKHISLNKENVKNQIYKIEAVIKYLKDDLNLDITDAYSERLIFIALDDIKTKLKEASIAVTRFEETESEKRLPVEIKVAVEDYKKIIDYMEQIESFRMPGYKINHFSISKDQTGNTLLNVRGAFVMPSFSPQDESAETEMMDTLETDTMER